MCTKKHKKSIKSEFQFFFALVLKIFDCKFVFLLLRSVSSFTVYLPTLLREKQRGRDGERGREVGVALPASSHYHWLTHSSNSCSLGCWRNFLHRLKHKVFAELPSIFSLFPLICTQPFISLPPSFSSFLFHSFAWHWNSSTWEIDLPRRKGNLQLDWYFHKSAINIEHVTGSCRRHFKELLEGIASCVGGGEKGSWEWRLRFL